MKLDEAVTSDEALRQFVQWGLAALGISATNSQDSTYDIPEGRKSFFGGADVAQLVYRDRQACDNRSAVVDEPNQTLAREPSTVPVDGAFLTWLIDELNGSDNVPYAVLTAPPLRVHEISARLFDTYRVEGGRLQLSGCTLEDRPLLRQTRLISDDLRPPSLAHRYTDPQGVSLPESDVTTLGLDSFKSPEGSLPRISREDVQAWCAAAGEEQPIAPEANSDPTTVSVVWCQYAAGKVEFTIGEASAEVAFSGWARQLVSGQVEPPAYLCPITGVKSHSIATTDDGRITAAEAIRVCAVSGQRVLATELAQCEQTGQSVLPEFLVTCPVSGQRVLESVLEPCGTCQQSVSPGCIAQGICAACRTMVPIRKDDPRMARVLGEYPRLDRWRNWRIGETSTSYILVAAAFIKRVLVVVNKESLEVVRFATRNRFSSHWADPPLTERQELLR